MIRRHPFLLLLALVFLLGCRSEPIIAPHPPPEAKPEVPTNKPGPGYFWRPGHYAWEEGEGIYYWVGGSWERERPRQYWSPGAWVKAEPPEAREEGWMWRPGRWESLAD